MKISTYKFIVKCLFITTLLYWVYIRFYWLWIQSFWIDEWFSSYSSLQLSMNNLSFLKDQYLLHSIFQNISFNVFDITDFSARFPSVLFSIINTFLIYIISISLFKDKRQAVLATILFSFLTWEIIWSRQARFYSLLQLLFSLNIFVTIKVAKSFSIKYLNIAIISIYIWILFHPFLYSNLILLGIILPYTIYKKSSLLKKKKFYTSILLITFIMIFETIRYSYFQETISISSTYDLPKNFIESYIQKYSEHLNYWLGILPLLSIIWMVILAYKKKITESVFLTFSYIFIFYIISHEWYLFHTRYLLILYPIILLLSSYTIFFIYDTIKNKYFKYIFLATILMLILISANFTFIPKSSFYIDRTSPQPNFKEAYKNIPNWKKIISWFPMLCQWYYSKKWECSYSLAINYFGDKSKNTELLLRWKDNLTNIRYLDSLVTLNNWNQYYFVIDNLTARWLITKNILNNLLKKWKIIYNNGDNYNNIQVIFYQYNK